MKSLLTLRPCPSDPRWRWWLVHAFVAVRRWVESALIPFGLYLAVRPVGVVPALITGTVWQCGVAVWRHRVNGGGIAIMAVLAGVLRVIVALVSVRVLLWLPVLTGSATSLALLSGKFGSLVTRDLALDLPRPMTLMLTRLWGVEQLAVVGANVTLVVSASSDTVMLVRPFLGIGAGLMTAAVTAWTLQRHLHQVGMSDVLVPSVERS